MTMKKNTKLYITIIIILLSVLLYLFFPLLPGLERPITSFEMENILRVPKYLPNDINSIKGNTMNMKDVWCHNYHVSRMSEGNKICVISEGENNKVDVNCDTLEFQNGTDDFVIIVSYPEKDIYYTNYDRYYYSTGGFIKWVMQHFKDYHIYLKYRFDCKSVRARGQALTC